MWLCAQSLSRFQLFVTLWTVAWQAPLSLGLCLVSDFSRVWFFMTLWTIAHQAPLSMGFSSKNTGVGCHSLLQSIFPTQGTEPASLMSLALADGFFTTSVTWETQMWVDTHFYMYICINMYMYMYICTCIYVYIYMYIHITSYLCSTLCDSIDCSPLGSSVPGILIL